MTEIQFKPGIKLSALTEIKIYTKNRNNRYTVFIQCTGTM